MKAKIIILAIALISTYSLSSQNYVTAKLATALSTQTNTGASGVRPGWVLGMGYEYQISDTWWLATGAEYIIKGSNTGTIKNVTQFSRRFVYVDVPLHAKYKYYVNNNFHWAIVGGANVGFTTKAENRFFAIAQPRQQEIPIDDVSGAKPIDLSLALGGELNFKTDYGYVAVFATLQPSIGGSATLINDLTGFSGSISNRVLTTGLMFKFGKEFEFTEKKRSKAKRSSR